MVMLLARNDEDIGGKRISGYWRSTKNETGYPFTLNQRKHPLPDPEIKLIQTVLRFT